MSRNFDYTAFEEHFRGDSQSIRQKLSVYLPLVRQLKLDDSRSALDIACGRGEWIQLLTENRIPASGIDINADSLAICRQQGLDVKESDLFDYLEQHPDERYGLVTGFHIIEHLSLEQQQELLRIVHDRLAPGGMMILETPNPENTTVGACDFYIDPTHTRPVPPPLLEYFAAQAGFACYRILRVNRSAIGVNLPALPNDIPGAGHYNRLAGLLLSRVFQAPDYALVAFREAAPNGNLLQELEKIVQANGCDVPDKQSRETLLEELRERDRQIARLNGQAEALERKLSKQQHKSGAMIDELEQQISNLNCRIDQREEELASLYNTELGKLLKKYKTWKKRHKHIRIEAAEALPPVDGISADSRLRMLSSSARQIFRQLSDVGAQCPADR